MTQGYRAISIRDAMENINAKHDGWFLPNIQRQYVWGSRVLSEEYICLLMDSLLRGFPIGGIVLWETEAEVPYREFLSDYAHGAVARMVPREKFSHHKFLVYDGQQRLQTLHTALYHRFNNRTLRFDLLFNRAERELDETGFFFCGSESPKPHSVSMLDLMGKDDDDRAAKVAMRNALVQSADLDEIQRLLVEVNFENLWEVFVSRNVQSLAYFPVQSDDSRKVNEVFRRLNTGGMQLSQLELVLAAIKEVAPYFEEELWDLSREIREATGTPGYDFTSHDIVQLIYLMVLQTARVDERRVGAGEVGKFIACLDHVKRVLPVVFKYFFFESFHINASWLLPRRQAILPILAYFTELEMRGLEWAPYKLDLRPVFAYFVKSQLCDWNTQTMVTMFAREVMSRAASGAAFPTDAITRIAMEKNRTGEVSFAQFEQALWFSLKVVTPAREYLLNERKPQIDHIFPISLHDGAPDEAAYRESVDVIWNMQPTPAGLNNYKRAKHPRVFFNSDQGRPYLASYDYLPGLDDESFADEAKFIAFRRDAMVRFMREKYGVELKRDDAG